VPTHLSISTNSQYNEKQPIIRKLFNIYLKHGLTGLLEDLCNQNIPHNSSIQNFYFSLDYNLFLNFNRLKSKPIHSKSICSDH
jgi:hypothetical protein